MILWSVVIDLCSFIRDIDSLGRGCVCVHTPMCIAWVRIGTKRFVPFAQFCSARVAPQISIISRFEIAVGSGVQYSYLCPYEFVYSIVERLNLYDGFGNTS